MDPLPRRRAAEAFTKDLQEAIPGRLRGAWLFGSVARGQDTPTSDVDVLVILDERDPDVLRTVYTLANDVSMALDVDLSVKVLGSADYERIRGSEFVLNVESEGVALA